MLKIHRFKGNDYPVVYTTESVYDYEVGTGRPFAADFVRVVEAMSTDSSKIPMVLVAEIVKVGMVAGAKQWKNSFTLDAREVFGLIADNMEAVGAIMVQVAESLPRRPIEEVGEGEASAPAEEMA